jgi:ectoine hydroxylase-related dioxygenase (phytanoyl-CoA dioxygenase family)
MKPMYDARKDKDGNVYMSHIIEDAKTDPTGKNLLVLLLQNLVMAKFFTAVRTFLNGTDLLFFTDACIMRKVEASGVGAITFHQDSGFTNENIRGVNIWLPLDACGVTAPTLSLIAISGSKFYYKDEKYGRFSYDGDYYLNETPVLEDFGECIVSPVLYPGDICMFDLRTIHRTNAQSDMTDSRTSLEMRVCPLNGLPPDFRYTRGIVVTADDQIIFVNG